MAGTTLLTHVNVVGREQGLYSVLVKDGQVETISKGDIPVDGQVELVNCRRKDGSSLWLSPVSLLCSISKRHKALAA